MNGYFQKKKKHKIKNISKIKINNIKIKIVNILLIKQSKSKNIKKINK